MKTLGRKYVLLMVLGAMGLVACKKDQIEIPESNDPVFRTDGTIGSESFSLIAGDNNAYMYTMTEVENGVNVYSGKISDGHFSVELGFYDGMLDMPSTNALQNLVNGSTVFAHHDSSTVYMTLSRLLLADLNSQYVSTIDWYIDGVFAGTNEVEITEPGKYNVCAYATFTDGKTVSFCNELIAGYERSANCMISISNTQLGHVMASLDNPGYDIDHVKWFVDGVYQTQTQGVFVAEIPTPGIHTLSAEVHFENGVVRTKTMAFDPNEETHTMNDFSIFEYQSIPLHQDFNVRLKIEDNGTTYLSELADNSSASLLVTGFEYYGKNDNGKNVYKVTGFVSGNVRQVGSNKVCSVSFTTAFGIEVE